MPVIHTKVSTVGPAGPVGPAGVTNPRGAWSSGNNYAQGDMVTYSSAAYLALQASTSASPKQPDTNPTYWQAMGGVPGVTGATGAGYGGTSTTSLTPASGNMSFATQAGMAWSVGVPIQATSASTPASYMAGTVYSYASTTLVIAVTSYAGTAKSDWVFSAPTGQQGPQGIQGIQGIQGAQGSCYMSALITGPDTTKTITGATHGLGNAALMVTVYDNSSPRNAISAGWSVDATTFDVIISFAVAQSNYYVIVASGIPETGGLPGGTGIVKVAGGTPSIAVANVDYMPPLAGTGLLKVTAGTLGMATATVDYGLPLGFTAENAGNKGAAGGYAPLDGSAKVPSVNLPSMGSPATFIAENYNFSAISPGGTLTSGVAFTLPGVCPAGLNGNDTGHYVYIPDTTNPSYSEAALIAGGTARSGVLGGTLILTCAHTHSGVWSIVSAFGGVQETVNVAAAAFPYSNAKILLTYAYGYNCYAPCLVPVAMDFDGGLARVILKTTAGFAFQVEASGCRFSRMSVWSPAVGGQVSGSAAIKIGVNGNVTDTWVENSEFWQLYDCIVGINAQRMRIHNNYFANFSHTAILAGNTTAHDLEMLKASGNSYFNISLSSPALADIYVTAGWVDLYGEDATHYVSAQTQYHVYVNRPLSTGGDRIFGCHFGYFTTAGIYFAAGAYQQYTTIVGNVIHNEDITTASKGIVVGTNFDGVTISDNTIQGAGSSVFTGIDVTGALRPTVGPNSITTLSSTPLAAQIAGYAGPPAYANNAAALAGGLSVGQIYRISSTDTMGIVH